VNRDIGGSVRDNKGREWRICGFVGNPHVSEALGRGIPDETLPGKIYGIAVTAIVFQFQGVSVSDGPDERAKAPKAGEILRDTRGRQWEVIDFCSNDHIAKDLGEESASRDVNVEIPVVIANLKLLGSLQ
jgi:hypothetical protein